MKLKNGLAASGQTQPKESYGDISNNDFAAIVPVFSGQICGIETNIVNTKVLHNALGVGRVFSSWFSAQVAWLDKCVSGTELTDNGQEICQSISSMGATLASNGRQFNA
ncbi:MAG TPA: hypothetical protein VJY31_18395 [Buttiauxella sp.]|nr:hypothetical protein [Buttiauxella sp.]